MIYRLYEIRLQSTLDYMNVDYNKFLDYKIICTKDLVSVYKALEVSPDYNHSRL